MTDSLLPVTAPIESPTSMREALADRFLARVAALSPWQWGQLDAIGQRFAASDPISIWESAGTIAAFAGRLPVLEEVVKVVGFLGMSVGELVTFGRKRRFDVQAWRNRHPRPDVSAQARPLVSRIETLMDLATHQPGGQRESAICLTLGLAALWSRDMMPPASFTRLYRLVEPVIPATSL